MSTLEYANRRRPSVPTTLLPFAEGTTVYGAVCVYHRLWGYSNRAFTLHDIYEQRLNSVHAFETHGVELSRTIFPHLSPREVLEQHTLYGFYSRGQTRQNADRWAAELTRGPRSRSGSIKKYLGGRTTMKAVKRECWFCADCVNEDRSEFGYATWRLLHQVPGIRFCYKHSQPLIAACQACGEIYDGYTRFRMPGEACVKCGVPFRRRSEASASAGEVEWARDCWVLASGRLPQLRPLEWAATVESYLARGKSAPRALWDEIKISWGGRLPDGVTRTAVFRELDLLTHPGQIVLRVVVYGALRRLGATCETPAAAPEQMRAVVRSALADELLPIGLASGLFNREPLTSLGQQAGANPLRVRKLIAALPQDLQRHITPAQRPSVVPPGLSAGQNLDLERLREKYRGKVLWALTTWDKPTRTMLWNKLPKAIMWLRANDAEWLDGVRPDKIRMDVYLNRIEPTYKRPS